MSLFTGLGAFPLTPLANDAIDERAFSALIERLVEARVDSITALGSTGSYAYLSQAERARVAQLAVQHAGDTPVFVGVGALRTSQVLENVDAAAEAGASGILLAPMSYQPLTDTDVFELFRTVSEHTELPIILYNNPGTTHFTFSTELYARIAKLPGIASIKMPSVPANLAEARERVASVRAVVPERVTIGISGDSTAAYALSAGCDAWYSVIGGTLPGPALAITRAALAGRVDEALTNSDRLAPLWQLFAEHGGSIRVIAAVAEHLGLAPESCLPLPIQGLGLEARSRVAEVLGMLDLT